MMLLLPVRHLIIVESKVLYKMKKIIFFALISITLNGFSQNSNRTIITIADEEVSVDDFLSIYNKNRDIGEEIDPKTLE